MGHPVHSYTIKISGPVGLFGNEWAKGTKYFRLHVIEHQFGNVLIVELGYRSELLKLELGYRSKLRKKKKRKDTAVHLSNKLHCIYSFSTADCIYLRNSGYTSAVVVANLV